MANPPFNLSDWGADKLQDDVRWKFGIPPSGQCQLCMVTTHDSSFISQRENRYGIGNGSLSSQTGGEGTIRENIIKADLIEGIVALPSQCFIPQVSCFSMVSQSREETER